MINAVASGRRAPILQVVLDPSQVNAVDAATGRELSGVFCQYRNDPELCFAMLTGAGNASIPPAGT